MAPNRPHRMPSLRRYALPKVQKIATSIYLPHRQEPRGIGGIFFDDYDEGGFEEAFAFMQSVGDHFLPAYQPIVARRKAKTTLRRNVSSSYTAEAATLNSILSTTVAPTWFAIQWPHRINLVATSTRPLGLRLATRSKHT